MFGSTRGRFSNWFPSYSNVGTVSSTNLHFHWLSNLKDVPLLFITQKQRVQLFCEDLCKFACGQSSLEVSALEQDYGQLCCLFLFGNDRVFKLLYLFHNSYQNQTSPFPEDLGKAMSHMKLYNANLQQSNSRISVTQLWQLSICKLSNMRNSLGTVMKNKKDKKNKKLSNIL